jgi:hypothetical protein
MSLLLALQAGTGYTLTCEGGVYSLSGQQATISRGLSLTAEHGSYTVTGQHAEVALNRVLTCLHGTYALSGQASEISVSGATDTRLDQILALLTSTKIYDESTGLWRVYEGPTELADDSGVLWRGLHGWMLIAGRESASKSGWLVRRRRGR